MEEMESLEYWNVGMMEYRNDGNMGRNPNIPVFIIPTFHHSNISIMPPFRSF